MSEKSSDFEKKIGYNYHNKNLLEQALTHSSYSNEKQLGKLGCNERLEFLGDAVLELVSSEYIYNLYPEKSEGDLSKIRAGLVCEQALSYCASEIDLGAYLLLGKGEDATGGRYRDSIVSDALEAVIGSIFFDGGFTSAKEFILKFVLNDIEHKQIFYDSKTILQEIIQAESHMPITYCILGEDGPEHEKIYEAGVQFDGKLIGSGKGRSKKAAEQRAAYNALINIKK